MNQMALSELVFPKVKEHYGKDSPQEISQRIGRELALIEANGWEKDFLCGYEITQHLRAAGELWMLPGIDGGFSLSVFLLGITSVNPLPPHYYCPKCKRVEFSSETGDGFGLPGCTCPRCGTIMRGDGHGIGLDDSEAYFAARRTPYELFSEWRVSDRGRYLIGEYLSQHGPITPFFSIGFEKVPEYPVDPYEDTNGERIVCGWVLASPETLPVTKWKAVEHPEGSGRSVQAFFREDELANLPHMYQAHTHSDVLGLLCRKTGVEPEDIPCNETHGFFCTVQEVSAGYNQPDSPSAKVTGINRAILKRRLEWFSRHYPEKYAALDT